MFSLYSLCKYKKQGNVLTFQIIKGQKEKKLRFYLFIHETHREREREAETQAEGEAGPTQGARRGTRSRVSRTTTRAEGRRYTAEPPGLPTRQLLKFF